MVAGCGSKILKFLLIFFNSIFWLSGLAILGVGIWLRVDKRVLNYQELLKLDSSDEYLNIAAYLLIAFGAFVVIVGFAGCCGALRESKCLLGFYAFFLLLILVAEISVGGLAAYYRNQVEGKVDNRLNSTLTTEYGKSDTITVAWNFAQYYLDCCGYKGYTDYELVMNWNATVDPVPYSCCKLKGGVDFNGRPSQANVNDWPGCRREAVTSAPSPAQLYTKGCKNALVDWVKNHAAVLIGVGIGIGLIELFGIIAACCLCRNIGKDDESD